MKKTQVWATFLVAMMVVGLFYPSFSNAGTDTTNDVNFSRDVIYQIVTDRFLDGNTANNPTGDLFSSDCSNLRKYCGGDWQGVINKIKDGYLTNMGITAIWISQPVENVYSVLNDPAGSTSYHGYWARDFKKTNPFFGSMTDFENLISVAHQYGLKVIIDFAPNHTSPASETDPSYMENGNLYDNGTYIASYSDDPNGLFHHNGGTDFSTLEDGIYRNLFDLADFNHQAPTMDRITKEAISLWLSKGVDGIRMDAVKHMPLGWQKSFMDRVYDQRPVFTFGEWFLGENEVDPQNHAFANESGMSLLDFEYAQELRQVLRNNTDGWKGFDDMINRTASSYEQVNDQVTFIDNHDMDRFSVDGGDTRKTDMALAVLLTSRGVPNIYYGTEQYITGNGDPNNRKKMTSFSTTTRAYQVTKKLAPLRQSNPAIAYGTTQQRWINSDVYIYERKHGNHVALVAINRGSSAYNITGLYTALPAGSYSDVLGGLLNGNSITVNSDTSVNAFELGAGEVAVWQYTKAGTSPIMGHVGPVMGQAGHTVTIDGEGFGSTQGTVKIGSTTASIVSWSDQQVKAKIPSVAGGKYSITVTTSNGVVSNSFANYEVMSWDQVSVRFVVNGAETSFGTNVYLVGNIHELGSWDTNKAIGPLFNQVVYQYPTWYFDVSVPGGRTIEFKFIKKDANGNVTWESGSNHVYTTPTGTTGQVTANWQN